MDRTIFWSQNQSRTFDYVAGDHDALDSLAQIAQDYLGGTSAVVAGFAATATGPTSLNINLASGRIYQLAAADATAIGAIPQDLTQILQQGVGAAQLVSLIAPTTIGQSQWSLIQAQFSQVDSIRASDPNGGLLYFYNSVNTTQPFQGPANNGQTTPTVRRGLVTVQVVQGASAATGSEVPPNPTAGWVPLYLIDLAYGQTVITQGQILQAGPSVGTNVPNNYAAMPLLTGLIGANPTATTSHHGGVAGQAAKINLATEAQGTILASQVGPGFAALAGLGTQAFAMATAAAGTNTTQGASTAFVQAAVSTATVSRRENAWFTPGTVNYTAPANMLVRITVVGGGGGGSSCSTTVVAPGASYSSGGGGGAGGLTIGVYSLTAGQVIAVTVGAGGGSQANGGTTSFGAMASASGGLGASFPFVNVSPGAGGGVGSGGTIVNFTGAPGVDGQYGTYTGMGCGGSGPWGGGGRAYAGANTIPPIANGNSAGAGGGGCYAVGAGTNLGASGANGIVILEEIG